MNTITITETSFVCQSTGNIVSDMGGEKVMLSIERGKYYNLGQVGGEIWSRMENPIQVGQLIHTLLSTYDVDQNKCVEQVYSFIKHLYEEGLIKIS